MPGNTLKSAFENYINPIIVSLRCLNDKIEIKHSTEFAFGQDFFWTTCNQDYPEDLNRIKISPSLWLSCRQTFRFAERSNSDGIRCYGVNILGYRYTLTRKHAGELMELRRWEWHPSRSSKHQGPHIHVNKDKEPIIAERASIENVIRTCWEYKEVKPVIDDWERVISSSAGPYER